MARPWPTTTAPIRTRYYLASVIAAAHSGQARSRSEAWAPRLLEELKHRAIVLRTSWHAACTRFAYSGCSIRRASRDALGTPKRVSETCKEVSQVPQRIAMISDHASPLAPVGGVDSGGQNIYVAETARALAARGYSVDVFTRRDQPELPEVVEWVPGVRVVHVPAGPAAFVRKEDLLPWMPEFTAFVQRFAARERYDIVHAHFFMSGLVAMHLKSALGLPFVVTFHALGLVRRLHQGTADEFSPRRISIEREVIESADAI